MIKLIFLSITFFYASIVNADIAGNDLIDRCRTLEHQLALIRYDLKVKPDSVRLYREYGLANKEFQALLCPVTSVTRNSVVFDSVHIVNN